jgi:CHRD domain
MRRIAACNISLALAIFIGATELAAAQNTHMGMAMARTTLLVAQLDGRQVVGGGSSSATGTGTFLLDPSTRTLNYNLTYEGLESGGAKSITLRNFGKGGEGEVIKTICSSDAEHCPSGAGATLSGALDSGGRPLENSLIGEFDSGRVYVEVVGADGKPEIRGQLGPNTAMVMVMSFVAHLAPIEGSESKGAGTAIVSETYLPGGKTSVFYAATVADTSGAPTNVALVGGPAPTREALATRLSLPELRLGRPRKGETGGSLSGTYVVDSAVPNPLLATRLMNVNNGQSGIVVTTSRFPHGELYGALVPVR